MCTNFSIGYSQDKVQIMKLQMSAELPAIVLTPF